MLRVLFADDQIPEEDIPDEEVFDSTRRAYPNAQEEFIRAFEVMRRAVRAIKDDNEVTVARRFDEALSLIQTQEFDVAIIDLGWYADPSVRQGDRATAGWKIARALDEADERHPERQPTAQIIYSARFDSQPALGQTAANDGRLPVVKPYQERFTIPLESPEKMAKSGDKVDAAYQSLRATLSFIEHERRHGPGPQEIVNQNLNLLRKNLSDGVNRAVERERRWDAMTRWFIAASVVIVLIGVVSLFFFGVPQGAVTAAVGIVVGLVPRLMYGELDKTRRELEVAKDDLTKWVTEVQHMQANQR